MGHLVPDGGGSGDVVVAPATPAGTSALAVVRLTGPPGETLRVVRRLAPDLPDPVPPREACVAHLVDGGGEALDEAIVLFFEGPRSPTGEDVVEVCCHGSPAIVRGILEAARHAGARPARPGEFTRRALEHGKVDLARAEGIALLSSARSSGSARRAYGLARGDLSRKVSDIRERLLDLLSAVEAALDFPDDVAADDSGAAVVNGLVGELERLAGCRSRAASDGAPVVVIAGRANAGKSTLFNALVGSDRAIVTPVAGTTRDAVAEEIEIAGERVRLYDTAGFVDAPGDIERLGMDVAGRAAAGADLVLWLVDGNGRPETAPPLSAESDPGEGRRRLLVETKKDLWRNGRSSCDGAMAVSAVTGEGLEELRRKIVEVLALQENEGEVLLLERHRRALEETVASLRNAAELTEPELSAAALRRALSALGEITGETASEEMIDRIFSSFCIGK